MSQLFRWLHLLIVAITLLAYLAPYIHPVHISWLGILAAGFPLLLVSHLLFFAYWLWQRRRFWWYSLISLLAGSMYMGHLVGFQGEKELSKAVNLRIATFNVGSFRNPVTGRSPDETAFNAFIRETAPDILCLQEFALKPSTAQRYVRRFSALNDYPYQYRNRTFSGIILSRYPIRTSGQIDISSHSNGCIYADIDIDGQTIRIYNAHLQSNKITLATNDLAEEGDIIDSETWKKAKGIVDIVRNAAAIRADQAIQITVHRRESPYPSVICGDFNETPLSYAYRKISEDMQDAFYVAGRGAGFTYAGNFPFLTLDYVLADKSLEVGMARVYRRSFSDHQLLMATFILH